MRNRYFPMLVKQDIPTIKLRFIADLFVAGRAKPCLLRLAWRDEGFCARDKFCSVN